MFYLTTHSTHFIYSYMEGKKEMFYLTTHSTQFYLRLYGRKEGNVLFNDTFNTFYLRLYGVGHMVKRPFRREWGEVRVSTREDVLPISEGVIMPFKVGRQINTLSTHPFTRISRRLRFFCARVLLLFNLIFFFNDTQ